MNKRAKIFFLGLLMAILVTFAGCTPKNDNDISNDIYVIDEENNGPVGVHEHEVYTDIPFSGDELVAIDFVSVDREYMELEKYFKQDDIEDMKFTEFGPYGNTLIVIPRDDSIEVSAYYVYVNENGELVESSEAMSKYNKPFFASLAEFEFVSCIKLHVYKEGKEITSFNIGQSGMDGHMTFEKSSKYVRDLTPYDFEYPEI